MNALRPLLLWASRNAFLRERIPRYGFARRAVRRFMPGEDLDSALRAADELSAHGLSAVLTRLGENITDDADADEVATHYLDVLDRVAERGLDAEVSIKLTQLGLDLDVERTYGRLARIAERARERRNFLWIDMESSDYVEATLDVYRRARVVFPNIGICLQSYLYRSGGDVDSLLGEPAAIRLVKGAYAEPRDVAYPNKDDVDESFFRLGERMLRDIARGASLRVGFGTHDLALVDRLYQAADALDLPKHAFEVQMLYGIRAAAQRQLAAQGRSVRVLISYGDAWYPWYLRRLAERPANLLFVLRAMFGG